MKTTSKEGVAIIAALDSAGIGKVVDIQIQSLIPSLQGTTQVMLIEREVGRYWQVSLYWCAVLIGDVCIEAHNGNLVFEEC